MTATRRSLLLTFVLLATVATAAYAQAPSPPAAEFPYTGNRTAVWIVAQLHILFAAFILGAPIFVVISEWLGYRKQDPRYDRLAKEVTKVTVILYSMTALTGGLFIFVLLATYPQFTTWLINHFFLIFAVIYPLLFIAETIVLYLYMYMGAKNEEERAYYDWMGFVGNLIGVGALLFLPFMGYLLSFELCDYDASICPYMMADQLSMFFEMQGAMVGLIFLASNYYIWLSMKRIEGLERIRMSAATMLLMITVPVVFMLMWTKWPIPDIMSLVAPAAYVVVWLLIAKITPWTVSSQTMVKVAFLMVIVGNAIWMTPHAFVATRALAPTVGRLSLRL